MNVTTKATSNFLRLLSLLPLLSLLSFIPLLALLPLPTLEAAAVTISDELNAINELISTSSWTTLEQLTSMGIQYQSTVKREENICLQYYKAVAEYHLGKVKASIGDFRSATELCSGAANLGDIYGGLAESLLVDRQVRASIEEYKQAIRFSETAARKTMYEVKMEKAKSWIVDFEPHRVQEPSTSDFDLCSLNDFSEAQYTQLSYASKKQISNNSNRANNNNYAAASPPSPSDPNGSSLSIGLISSDWRVHPISTLLRGMIQHLASKSGVELYIFSVNDIKSVPNVDDGWWLRNITGTVGPTNFLDLKGLDEAEMTKVIKHKGLDCLVDLNGKTLGNSLGLFKHRLAQLQVTYLGLPQTTGLEYMDYFVADVSALGVDWMSEHFAESLALLDSNYIINDYRNLQGHVPKRHPFRLHAPQGRVFFSVASNFMKISEQSVEVYANIMRRVEGSKVGFFEYKGVEEGRENLLREFERRGISRKRIVWIEQAPWISHTWSKTCVDVWLDSSGKNGHTTGLDSAWSGAPVISIDQGGGGMNIRAGMEWSEVGHGMKDWENLGVAVGSDSDLRMGLREKGQGRREEQGGPFDFKAGSDRFVNLLKAMVGANGFHVLKSETKNGIPAEVEMEMEVGQPLAEGWNELVMHPSPPQSWKDMESDADAVIKLHIGGQHPSSGWTIVDVSPRAEVDVVTGMDNLSMFGDGSVDVIYASHVLEHGYHGAEPPCGGGGHSILATLTEWARVLKRGSGKLYVSVPDLSVLAKLFVDPRMSAQGKFTIMRIMYGGQTDAHDYHMVGFEHDILEAYFLEAGLCNFKAVEDFGFFQDTSIAVLDIDNFPKEVGVKISLNVVAEVCDN